MPVAYPTLSVRQRPGCPRLFESARQEGMGVKPHHHDSALAAASSVSVDRDGRSCKHRAAVTVPAKERKGQWHWSPRWCKVGKLQPTCSKQCTLHGACCAPCTALHVALRIARDCTYANPGTHHECSPRAPSHCHRAARAPITAAGAECVATSMAQARQRNTAISRRIGESSVCVSRRGVASDCDTPRAERPAGPAGRAGGWAGRRAPL